MSLANILGRLSIDGTSGTNDSLTLFDTNAAVATDLILGTNVFYPAAGTTTGGGNANNSFANLEAFRVYTSNAGSKLDIGGTAPAEALTIFGGSGPDLAQDGFYGLYDTQAPIVFNGGDGSDSLIVNDAPGTTGRDYTMTSTSITSIVFAGITYSNIESLALDGGNGNDAINVTSIPAGAAVRVNGDDGTDTIDIHAAAGDVGVSVDPSAGNDIVNVSSTGTANSSVTFDATQHLGALNVGDRATVTASSSMPLLVTNGLSITGTGKLDLNQSDLFLNYTSASPLSTVRTYIKSARGTGGWIGLGLTSSAAATNSLHNTTLGLMEATQYKSIAGATTFDGEPLSDTAVLVKYTYNGDADFNGKIDFGDYSRIDVGYQTQHNAGFVDSWLNGDFDYNGTIDVGDYALIDSAYQTQTTVLRLPVISEQSPSKPTTWRDAGGAATAT